MNIPTPGLPSAAATVSNDDAISAGAQGPVIAPFTFVHIPIEESSPPVEQRYEGSSDEELRDLLRSYFAKVGGVMNESQRGELQKSLRARLDSSKKKQEPAEGEKSRVEVVQEEEEGEPTEKKEKPAPGTSTEELLKFAVSNADDGSFEVVPVVLPNLKNKFIAVSLYIDSTGRIKDLPLNCRASKIAGREICGEAFLLSNHDDPALETWERIDTTLADFARMHKNPPSETVNLDDSSQSNAALAMRENLTRLVSAEDAAKSAAALDQGRSLFGQGNYAEAASKFGECFSLLQARTDLLPNDEELQKSKTVALLNGAACAVKLGRWSEAESLAESTLFRDPSNEKAKFRLATAKVKLNDFSEAKKIIQSAKSTLNEETFQATWSALEQECKSTEVAFKSQESKKFSKMFG